ncbi:MAG: YihA family ribosome biogenesis GTP-binding protein [Alphaproteobacteria bacterium]|nr:YihA family ribosome biogenesis GTP-binding protein [Alphaproteobacteria bacterium]
MRLRNAVSQLSFVGSFPGELPVLGRPEVAFAGRSNVGKSSALNVLLDSKKAARVSSTPGRTQAINLFDLGEQAVFADLPGYGFAKVPDHVKERWGDLIEGYLGTRETLRLVVMLVDIRRDPMESDGMLVDGLRDADIPLLVVATKCDKLKKQQKVQQIRAIREAFDLPRDQPIAFSSVTREGRDEVWDVIERACR